MAPPPPSAPGGQKLRSQLMRVLVPPFVLLVVSSGLLFWQIPRLLKLTEWVDHSTEVLSEGNELYRMLVDRETCLRGYLLTDEQTFLEPYRQGEDRIDAQFQELSALVADDAEQAARLESLRSSQATWDRKLDASIHPRSHDSLVQEMIEGKAQMDRIRVEMASFIEAERRLHKARTVEMQAQIRNSILASVTLLLTLAMSMGFSFRNGLVELASTYRHALGAERAARLAREEILAVVSHDLRNPLGVIMMNTGIALKTAPPGEAGDSTRRRATMTQRAASRMEQLIRDLLDASSIEVGHLPLELREHDACSIAAEGMELVSPLAEQKTIMLEVNLPLESCSLLCDRGRVSQLLSNLLGNAIKFTPEGGRVTLRVCADAERVTFTVADTGPGIREDQIPHIFERHWTGRGKAGVDTGLGLYIARGIVESHDGQLEVKTKPGLGTEFSFTLPRQRERRTEARSEGIVR